MDFYTQVHLAMASIAIPLGAMVLWRQKGDRLHKAAGRTWTGLILIVCMSSLGIRDENGDFTYIHLLTLWTFLCLAIALLSIKLHAAKRHSPITLALFALVGGMPASLALLEQHRNFMIGSYAGLIIAGTLAVLLPGRYLHGQLLLLF